MNLVELLTLTGGPLDGYTHPKPSMPYFVLESGHERYALYHDEGNGVARLVEEKTKEQLRSKLPCH